MAKKRTDAERRLRQCQRLSRLLSILRCISGPGRWDAEAMARELEVSPRTIHRDLQTLSTAGVPWYFDPVCQAYKVRAGFRFPVINMNPGQECHDLMVILTTARQVISDAERLVAILKQLCAKLEKREEQ